MTLPTTAHTSHTPIPCSLHASDTRPPRPPASHQVEPAPPRFPPFFVPVALLHFLSVAPCIFIAFHLFSGLLGFRTTCAPSRSLPPRFSLPLVPPYHPPPGRRRHPARASQPSAPPPSVHPPAVSSWPLPPQSCGTAPSATWAAPASRLRVCSTAAGLASQASTSSLRPDSRSVSNPVAQPGSKARRNRARGRQARTSSRWRCS